MAIRNFYLDAEIDGRKTDLHGGPQSKKGGMDIRIWQRKEGKPVPAFNIICMEKNGRLITRVIPAETEAPILEFETRRD